MKFVNLEARKYKAQAFLILGFAVATPFGKLIIDLFESKFTVVDFGYILALLGSLGLAFIGAIIVDRGLIHLE